MIRNMSIALLSKRHQQINWKVEEIILFLETFMGDPKLEYLTSAEFELKNLIDGIVHHGKPRKDDPPF